MLSSSFGNNYDRKQDVLDAHPDTAFGLGRLAQRLAPPAFKDCPLQGLAYRTGVSADLLTTFETLVTACLARATKRAVDRTALFDAEDDMAEACRVFLNAIPVGVHDFGRVKEAWRDVMGPRIARLQKIACMPHQRFQKTVDAIIALDDGWLLVDAIDALIELVGNSEVRNGVAYPRKLRNTDLTNTL